MPALVSAILTVITTAAFNLVLKGTVEVDETFVGGKGDTRTKHLRQTPVVALIERGGQMRASVRRMFTFAFPTRPLLSLVALFPSLRIS